MCTEKKELKMSCQWLNSSTVEYIVVWFGGDRTLLLLIRDAPLPPMCPHSEPPLMFSTCMILVVVKK